MIATSFADLAHGLGLWLANYLVHSTLLLLAAWGCSRCLRSPAQREIAWRAALLGGIATATLQPLRGVARFDATRVVLPAVVTHTDLGTRARPVVIESSASSSYAAVQSGGSAGNARWLDDGLRWPSALFGLWSIGALLGLVTLRAARRRSSSQLRSRRVGDSALVRELDALLRATSVRRAVVVSESAVLSSPVALSCKEICLPRGAWRSLTRGQLRSLLAHELAHVVRRDPVWLLAVHVLERVLFLQPLNRLARRELTATAEFLCDDWAAEHTSEPRELASCLAEVASWVGATRATSSAPAMVRQSSGLLLRVRRLLGEREPSTTARSRRAWRAGWGAILGVLACCGPSVAVESGKPAPPKASIEPREAPFGTVSVDASGMAAVLRDGRELGRADPGTREGRERLAEVLATLARSMPEGASGLPSGRLRIRVPAQVPFACLRGVMECCARAGVRIWRIEVAGVDTADQVFVVPLPVDVGLGADGLTAVPEAIEESADEVELGPWPASAAALLELRVESRTDGVSRAVEYVLSSNRWSLERGEIGSELSAASREPAPFRTRDAEHLSQLLTRLHAQEPRQRVSIDALPGTPYADVAAALASISQAGLATGVVFVGSRE